MSQVGWSNAVSLIIAGLTFAAGSEVLYKSVCKGESTQLFNSRIQKNTSDTVLHLYKNGDKHRNIAQFDRDVKDGIVHDNIIMDKDKYLWIINVHITDQGYYILQYDFRHGDTLNITTYLSVLVAPDTNCKPVIKHIGNTLTARLPNTSCGTPVASAYWKDCSDITCKDTNIRTLQAGREAGTYYACTTGPALSCARSSDPSSDYCSAFRIEQSSDCGKDDLHELLHAIVGLQCVLFVTIMIFGIHGCCTYYRRGSTSRFIDDTHIAELSTVRQPSGNLRWR